MMMATVRVLIMAVVSFVVIVAVALSTATPLENVKKTSPSSNVGKIATPLSSSNATSQLATTTHKTPLRVRRRNTTRTHRSTDFTNIMVKSTPQPLPSEDIGGKSTKAAMISGSGDSSASLSSSFGNRKQRLNKSKHVRKTLADVQTAAASTTMKQTVPTVSVPHVASPGSPNHNDVPQERHMRYDPSHDFVPVRPKLYTYSQRMSYSASTGNEPHFSSSEIYSQVPFEEISGAGSEIVHGSASSQKNRRADPDKDVARRRKDCNVIQKPMPPHLQKSRGKVVMLCYVCGKKDDPFANGGYTEECDLSPTNQRDIYAEPNDGEHYGDRNSGNQRTSGTRNSPKLYAGNGQSPYLTGNVAAAPTSNKGSSGDKGDVLIGKDFDPYFGDPYYGSSYGEGGPSSSYSEATDNRGSVYGEGGDGAGYTGSGEGAAETDKSTCKVVYRGKMKCKVCGDPNSDAAFEEQCDYEKDQAPQHHSHAYDYASNDEKQYSSKPQGNKNSGDDGGGGGGGHYDGGHGGDSYGYDDGAAGYPDEYSDPGYDHYGSGTYYDPNGYNSEPYFKTGGDVEGRGRPLGDEDTKTSKGSQKVQPQATTTITDKKDINDAADGHDDKGSKCKVIYKDLSSYSPYTNKKDKPKMKCLVCNGAGGYGGVTEECSYSGAGQVSFGPSDVSPYFGDNSDDSFYYSPFGFEDFRDVFF